MGCGVWEVVTMPGKTLGAAYLIFLRIAAQDRKSHMALIVPEAICKCKAIRGVLQIYKQA